MSYGKTLLSLKKYTFQKALSSFSMQINNIKLSKTLHEKSFENHVYIAQKRFHDFDLLTRTSEKTDFK